MCSHQAAASAGVTVWRAAAIAICSSCWFVNIAWRTAFLILEKAYSMGFMKGEYGGKNR